MIGRRVEMTMKDGSVMRADVLQMEDGRIKVAEVREGHRVSGGVDWIALASVRTINVLPEEA
jgi:hypothetical protein